MPSGSSGSTSGVVVGVFGCMLLGGGGVVVSGFGVVVGLVVSGFELLGLASGFAMGVVVLVLSVGLVLAGGVGGRSSGMASPLMM